MNMDKININTEEIDFIRTHIHNLTLATVPRTRGIRGYLRSLVHRAMTSRIAPTIEHQKNINYEIMNFLEKLQLDVAAILARLQTAEEVRKSEEELVATMSRLLAGLDRNCNLAES